MIILLHRLVIGLIVVITIISLGGIFIDDMYMRETANWRAQSIGQDIADLLLAVPMLILSLVQIERNERTGSFLMGGTLLFCLYTLLLYCFDVHFNRFFILYCIALGVSFYSLIVLMLFIRSKNSSDWFDPAKSVGLIVWFFRIVAAVFYVLWLSDIVPALIDNTTPKTVVEIGLPSNGVHVIDLAFFLPGIIIVSHYLLKRRPAAYIASAMFLIFSFIMAASIGVLIIYMYITTVSNDFTPAIVMLALSAASLFVYGKTVKLLK